MEVCVNESRESEGIKQHVKCLSIAYVYIIGLKFGVPYRETIEWEAAISWYRYLNLEADFSRMFISIIQLI